MSRWQITEGPEGYTPVQCYGVVDDLPWYFRARGAQWSLEIGGTVATNDEADITVQKEIMIDGAPVVFDVIDQSKIIERVPVWWHSEAWGTWPEAGYMNDEQVIECIEKAMTLYMSGTPPVIKRGDPGWREYIFKSWSEGFISTDLAVEELDFDDWHELKEYALSHAIELPFSIKYKRD